MGATSWLDRLWGKEKQREEAGGLLGRIGHDLLYYTLAEQQITCPPLIVNEKDGSILVWIPPGEFEMWDGKDDDCPKHRVFLAITWECSASPTVSTSALSRLPGWIEVGEDDSSYEKRATVYSDLEEAPL